MYISLNQLRSFYYAAQLSSIKNAAQKLMVTPSAISMQIKHLEEMVGIKLTFRDGNSISLTEVGKSVFKRAEEIFIKTHEMEEYLTDVSLARRGEIRIGCNETFAKNILPNLIKKFKVTYPGIKIIFDQGTSAEMVQHILDGRIELAFMRGMLDDQRIKIKILGGVQLVCIAAYNTGFLPVDKISITQLPTLPLIMYKKGSGARALIFEYFRKFKIEPNISMELANIDLIKEMVLEDNGIAFLGKLAVTNELKNKTIKIINIMEGLPTIQLGIGYLKRKHLSPAAWAFLHMFDKIEEILPDFNKG